MRLFLAAAVLAFLAAPAAARATPVLGSPDYITSGAGWGTSAPHEVFNGGSPGGLVDHIKWRRWGKPVARGRGKANIYRPNGGYYPPVTTVLRARKLGTCPGRSELAYLVLELRTPNWPGGPLGPWLKWSGSRTLCDYDDTDPAYDYPKRPPGLCADIGEYGEPTTINSIQSYRLSCKRARQVARGVRTRLSTECAQSGCTKKVHGLTCRLARVRSDETIGIEYPYPAQRVACRRGSRTMSAWAVLFYD
jgi:hypothetical protein